ncbi:MAG: hypothetical protein JO328_21580 [Hyphomicrobiales bacterium]|nr:hypothetical protein [Hyphomicrobiales bacterium]
MVAVSFGITVLLLERFGGPPDDCDGDRLIAMNPPFDSNGGKAFVAHIQVPGADTNEMPRRSTLVVCEDHKRLGPAHTLHEDIRGTGRGRYSHWGADVIFSSSDDSDPNTNRRRYSYLAK